FALHQQILTVGGGNALRGIGDLCRRIGESKLAEHERHKRALRESCDDLAWRVAEHARFVALSLVNAAAQVARFMNSVGVSEQQPAATGTASGGEYGVGLAGPARGQLAGLDHADSWKRARNFGGAVGGLVVDDDEFPVAAKLEDLFGFGNK